MTTLLDVLDPLTVEGKLYEKNDDGSVRCYACGHRCLIRDGKRGICKVRYNQGGKLMVPSGYVAALQTDPIEKKPFFHFLPGSDALTFGMLGCDFHCGYCFTGDTIVFTDHGPITLKEAYQSGTSIDEQPDGFISHPNNFKAITGSGAYQKVRAVFKHPYQGKLAVVHPYYLPELRCTLDHRVYATDDPAKAPVIIRAESLTLNHYLAIPKISQSSGYKTINVEKLLSGITVNHRIPWKLSSEKRAEIVGMTADGKTSRQIGAELGLDASYVRQIRSKVARGKGKDNRLHGTVIENGWIRFSKEHRPGIPCQIELNEEFASLLGYYCAEGSIITSSNRTNSHVLNFSFGLTETASGTAVAGLMQKTFQSKPRLVKRPTTLGVAVTSASTARLFTALAGKGAREKFVPQQLFTSPKPVIQAFLDAYVEGDGHKYENGKVSCTTVSKKLAYGIGLLALMCGRMPSIYETKFSETAYILSRKVRRAPSQYTIVWYEGNGVIRKLIETQNHFLVPMKEIHFEDFEGDVYNMEVEEEHNYLAGFFQVSNCQNWVTSQAARDPASDISLQFIRKTSPEQLVDLARRSGAKVVVSSYNEPLITAEWAVEVFKKANEAGFKCAFVSNGNMTPQAIEYLRPHIVGYKIDLKCMQDKHYRELGGVLENVLEGIRTAHAQGLWVEIVTLVVPGFNDSTEELMDAARFIASVSRDIPWHVTAFHPDYKMIDPGATPAKTLLRAAEIGQEAGLNFVYAGNLTGRVNEYENTLCSKCGKTLIERIGYTILKYNITAQGTCPKCAAKVPGIWPDSPESVRLNGAGLPRLVVR